MVLAHIQSDVDGRDAECKAGRATQLQLIADHITSYRISHPSVPVIFVGDLNVPDQFSTPSGIEIDTIATKFSFMRDALTDSSYRNQHPGTSTGTYVERVSANGGGEAKASKSGNLMACYFDKGYYGFVSDADWDARLDYVLYCDSSDRTVRVTPNTYQTVKLTRTASSGTLCKTAAGKLLVFGK